MIREQISFTKNLFNTTILVSALGYFVDIYDLVLFGIVRIPSLLDLGIRGDGLINTGVFLLKMQMGGMLNGGIISVKWMNEIEIRGKNGNQKEIITIDSLWGGYAPNKNR